MMKEVVARLAFFFALFLSSVMTSPVFKRDGPSDIVKVVAVNQTEVCQVDGEIYHASEELPTHDPCEYCTCQPPGIACEVIKCQHKEGCRSLQRSGLCCPEYVCDCELNDKIYMNGDRVTDHPDPCEDCYCVTGIIRCSVIQCLEPPHEGCTPVSQNDTCCPTYDCPPKPQETKAELQSEDATTVVPSDDNASSRDDEDPLATTKVPILEEEPKAEESERYEVTEVTVPEVDKETSVSDSPVLQENVKSEDDVDGLDSTTVKYNVDEAVKSSDGDNTTEKPVIEDFEEPIEKFDDITTKPYLDENEREDVTSGTVKPEDIIIIQEDKPEEEDKEYTKTPLVEVTKINKQDPVDKKSDIVESDQITSTQASNSADYEAKQNSAETDSQNQESPSPVDFETLELGTTTGPSYRRNEVEETTQKTNEVEVDKNKIDSNEGINRDTETSTSKVSEDEQIEEVTEHSILSVNSDQQNGHLVTSSVKQEDEETLTTETPDSKIEINTKKKPKPEIVKKIYKSDIEELKNKLIIRVRGESAVSAKDESVHETKEDTVTEGYEATTKSDLSDDLQDSESNLYVVTSIPEINAINREDLTTLEYKDTTKIPVTYSPVKKQNDKTSEYWINMMQSNVEKNATNVVQGVEEEEEEENEANLREEVTTQSSSITEEFTRLYLKSDLLSQETAQPETENLELFATTEETNKERQEIEETTVVTADVLQLNADTNQELKDESVSEIPTTALPPQTVVSEIKVETEIPPKNALKFNFEPRIKSDVELTTVPEDLQTFTESAALNVFKNEAEETTLLPENASELEEEQLVTIETKSEPLAFETTQSVDEVEITTEGVSKISVENESKPINVSDFAAEKNSKQQNSKVSLDEENKDKISPDQQPEASEIVVTTVSNSLLNAATKTSKPARIEQKLSYIARKYGNLGLRPIYKRRRKEYVKRQQSDRTKFREQFFKRL